MPDKRKLPSLYSDIIALYLKQCASALQKAYAGDPATRRLPFPGSLTRSGYTTMIPSFHRRMILYKDEKADMLVKLDLSVFSLFRAIKLAKRIEKSLVSSIAQPSESMLPLLQICDLVARSTETLLRRYCPSLGVGSIPLVQGIRLNPTWKAIPSKSAVKDRKADKGIF